MMKRLTFIAVLVFSFAICGQAFAQDDEETDTEFYDFEDMHIDGEFVSPDLEHMEAQGEAQFDRLLNLQTSFIPKVEESTEDPSFR